MWRMSCHPYLVCHGHSENDYSKRLLVGFGTRPPAAVQTVRFLRCVRVWVCRILWHPVSEIAQRRPPSHTESVRCSVCMLCLVEISFEWVFLYWILLRLAFMFGYIIYMPIAVIVFTNVEFLHKLTVLLAPSMGFHLWRPPYYRLDSHCSFFIASTLSGAVVGPAYSHSGCFDGRMGTRLVPAILHKAPSTTSAPQPCTIWLDQTRDGKHSWSKTLHAHKTTVKLDLTRQQQHNAYCRLCLASLYIYIYI